MCLINTTPFYSLSVPHPYISVLISILVIKVLSKSYLLTSYNFSNNIISKNVLHYKISNVPTRYLEPQLNIF